MIMINNQEVNNTDEMISAMFSNLDLNNEQIAKVKKLNSNTSVDDLIELVNEYSGDIMMKLK
jgi:phage-related minor tail protein